MAITTIPNRIVDLIEAEDIDTLFGIPDPSLFKIFIEAESRGMRVVTPHHEQAGAMMADAYYRMTGKPGIVGINKGPGVANIISGAAYLAKENIPAVFIGAQRHRFYEQRVRRGKMQYESQPGLFKEVMKYVGVIEYAEQVDDVIRETFRQALSGVPGPTYVELPLNVMQWELDLPPALTPSQYRLVNQRASDVAVADAAKILQEAKQPVLLLGQGAFVSRAHKSVAELATKLGCPILNSSAVEAVIEGMDDVTFPYGSDVATEIIRDADAVIAIGTEIGETLHYGRGHRWSHGNSERKWIYIERDPTAIGVNRPIDVPLVGDLRDVVPQLTEALGSKAKPANKKMASWAESHRKQKVLTFADAPKGTSPVHPAELTIEATRVLPEDTVLVRDGGASSLYFLSYLNYTPRDAMWNSNYGAVGPGLPYAIGAQLAVGDSRHVILLTGDSSMLFHISELETAVRFNLPIICVVSVDNAWGIEVASYKVNCGADAPTPGAHWGEVRLDKTAESFGAYGQYVERGEDLAPAVERAIASGRPSLIHVAIDKNATSDFGVIPGMGEFRTWYGEEGDPLGGPPTAAAPDDDGDKSTDGSGY